MTIRTPSWLQAGSYPAENDRLLLQSLLGGSPNQTPASGVIGSADLAVTASGTPDMNVHAAAGAAFIKGTETTTQGVYGFYSDASVTVGPLAASDPTNDRISLIVAQILDAGYSGSSNIGQIVEVAGTPASTPVAPAVPKNSIVLAQVRVPKLATAITAGNITDERQLFVPGPLSSSPYRANVYRNATWTTVTGPAYPQYDTNTYNPAGYFTANLFTCPAAGDYSIKASLGATATAVNQYFYLQIVHNSTVVAGGAQYHSVGTNDFMIATVNYEQFQCAAGDTLAIQYGCSTAGLTGSTGPVNNWAIFRYLGR